MADMTLPRYWKVRGSYPVTKHPIHGGPYTYRPEVVEGVVARTAAEAIGVFMRMHPDGTVWAVNHTGQVHATAEGLGSDQ